MMDFRISNALDSTKVFLMPLSKIEGRLDPSAYHIDRLSAIQKLKDSGVSLKQLKFLVTSSKETVKEIESSDIVYVGLENIESNTGDYIPTNEKVSISSALVFKKGDILFPKLRPYLNKVFYATFDGICSTEFHVFKSDELDNEYLSHFLRSNLVVRQTQKLMSGNTLPRVQTSDIYNLLIPVIRPKKQEEVNQLLGAANEKRKLKQKEATDHLNGIEKYLLKELGIVLPVKDVSIIARMFTTSFNKLSGSRFDPFYNQVYFNKIEELVEQCNFSTQPLFKLCYPVRGVTYSRNDESQTNSGIEIIRANNITLETNELNLDDVRYIRDDFPVLARQKLYKHDILMSAASGSKEHVGKVAFIEEDLPYYFGGFMSVLRCYPKQINPEYLFYYLQSNLYREILFRVLGGTNINNLNFSMISKFRIPVPSPEKQTGIVNHIRKIRFEAKRLRTDAYSVLENARKQIEEMILKP